MNNYDENGLNATAVLSISNLCAGYNGDPVLDDINLTVYQKDFIGIIGPNGGGKTTLIKVLLGLIKPTRGEVSIMGLDVHKGRWFIGYVPQILQLDQDFPISVWDVVSMGRLGKQPIMRQYSQDDDRIVTEVLNQVEMFECRKYPIGDLSTGQRQRVYIARALAVEPSILLLDEPTSSIDPHMSTNVYELLKELNNRVTIILISHDMSAISSYVKTIACLNHRMVYHGEKQITADMLEAGYQCPVDFIAHGLPHRVFSEHAS
jgi:zinc transport system ATP-binding protein